MPTAVRVSEVLPSEGLSCHFPDVGYAPKTMAPFRTTGNRDCNQLIFVSTFDSPWKHRGAHHPTVMFLDCPGDISGVLASEPALKSPS